MSDLGKVPSGLMRSAGAELWWALMLSELRHYHATGEWIVVFPLRGGVMTMRVLPVDHGTGSDVSGS